MTARHDLISLRIHFNRDYEGNVNIRLKWQKVSRNRIHVRIFLNSTPTCGFYHPVYINSLRNGQKMPLLMNRDWWSPPPSPSASVHWKGFLKKFWLEIVKISLFGGGFTSRPSPLFEKWGIPFEKLTSEWVSQSVRWHASGLPSFWALMKRWIFFPFGVASRIVVSYNNRPPRLLLSLSPLFRTQHWLEG